jgi:aryl-alcohol dehydrogenase-like predicted oxidoreductase
MDLVNPRLMNANGSGDLLAEQLGALEIGISAAGADVVRRALKLVDIAEVQNPYSVANRSGEDILEPCIELENAGQLSDPVAAAHD